MRLAGAYHIKPGREPIQSRLILNSGKTYPYEQLREIIPKRQPAAQTDRLQWHEFEKNFRLPINESVPLYECLTKTDRDLIERGVGQGERNAIGYARLVNLLATADYLNSIGQAYEGNPRQLFEQFCHNCAPPIEQGEIESIWKSANGGRATTTSLSPDAIENCIKAWKWRQIQAQKPRQLELKSIDNGNRSRNTQPQTESVSLRDRIVKILTQVASYATLVDLPPGDRS
jgi:hypothetical protein